ncbi:MAG: aldehyde ferredoxin oxidoreductase C-terminal domain-containing protein [Myxococcota bacterium]|jgi:aldehyde:ferredoxin oxidoreductase|nr:aldehyde ferredoxin oxidoreductase C-terminal domain-containing protein [Myxococcota bacterium]
MAGPEGDRLLHVDMTTQTTSFEDFPAEWKLLGGRGLSAKILTRDCDPTCDPLGPDNVLVMAPGVLGGSAAPTSGRISIGCKSPLTHGIKEANAGGQPAQHLMKLGIRAIVVKGQPADRDKRYGMRVTADGVEVIDADDCKGMWNYALCAKLLENESKTASVISIGPAGEQMLTGASVACTDQDKDRRPARHAARGGPGAVMGSKGLKYVVVDPGKAPMRKAADPKGYTEVVKARSKEYIEGPQMMKSGTASVVPVANMLNTFPYKNRTEGQSPDVDNLDGARIHESFEERGGGMHNCLTGCIVSCSNVVHDKEGNYKTSALEFETLTLLGACCAIDNWDDVADLDRLCDELGLDTIETGAAIAALMDAGEMQWGDAEGAKKLFDEIASGSDLGKAIGNGAVAVGKRTGHKRIPNSRGQAIPAWDPRPLKATGITYCTSPMGADHTAGLIVNPAMAPDDMAQASQEVQLVNAVCDSSGFCQFLGPDLDMIREYYSQLYGEEVSREQIADQGWEILSDEWAFNEKAGWKAEDDVLSDDMVNEGIGPDQALKFDLAADVVAKAKVRFDNREELFKTKASG